MVSHHIIYKVQFKNVINIFSHGLCDKKINNIKSTKYVNINHIQHEQICFSNICFKYIWKWKRLVFLFDLAYQS